MQIIFADLEHPPPPPFSGEYDLQVRTQPFRSLQVPTHFKNFKNI